MAQLQSGWWRQADGRLRPVSREALRSSLSTGLQRRKNDTSFTLRLLNNSTTHELTQQMGREETKRNSSKSLEIRLFAFLQSIGCKN